MKTQNKDNLKVFNRFNVLQIGIIPFHFTLLIFFSRMFQDFTRIDIPIDTLRGMFPETIHMYLIAPTSFWNVIKLILFFLTFLLFLSFLDYVDFQLRLKIFGEKAKPAVWVSVFSVLVVLSIIVYHIFNSTLTIPIQEYLTLLEEDFRNNATTIQSISDVSIYAFFVLPLLLQLFPCEVIYKYIRSIGLFFVTLCSNTHKEIPAEKAETVFNLSEKLDPILFLSLYIDPDSWKLSWLLFEILRIFYFSFVALNIVSIMPNNTLCVIVLMIIVFLFVFIILNVGESLYVNEVESFCEAISLDPINRNAWIDEYNKNLESLNLIKSEENMINTRKKEIQLYIDALLHLLQLLSKDHEKANHVVQIIKKDIQKEQFTINNEIHSLCHAAGHECIVDDMDIDRLITADKTIFKNMLRQIITYAEKISPPNSPIIFEVSPKENNGLFNCTIVVNSSMISNIHTSIEFLQLLDTTSTPPSYEDTEALCLILLYAAVNDMVVTYELIDKQLFCLKIISA